MPETRIRVLLADDHALVLEGMRSLLGAMADFEVIGTAIDGQQVLDLLARERVDVLVMDWQMPPATLRPLVEIRRRGLPVHVLILSAFSDVETIRSAIEQGADGFCLKTEAPGQVIGAIRQIAQGQMVFPRAAQRWLAQPPQTGPGLSEREIEVLRNAAEGRTNSEIAAILSVSENTVRFHLKNIYEKLNVKNRTEAAAWYLREGRG